MKKTQVIAVVLTAVLLGLLVRAASAQGSASYGLNWHVFSGGGAPATAGNVSLNGSLGQTAIGLSNSNSVNLSSGYWFGAVVSAPPGEDGGSIYLPVLFKDMVPGPDLQVVDLTATSSQVTVVVKNVGTSTVTDAFWVDVYFNPRQAPRLNERWIDIADHGLVWGVTAWIPAGESVTLTNSSNDPYYFPQLSSQPPLPVNATVYALADSINFATSFGAVPESNEGNNLSNPVLSTAGTPVDPAREIDSGSLPSADGLPDRK